MQMPCIAFGILLVGSLYDDNVSNRGCGKHVLKQCFVFGWMYLY